MLHPALPLVPEHADKIRDAVRILREGGLVALPTETVYGLGADATQAAAVRRIFEAKGRPPGHPLIVHLAARADWRAWGIEIPPGAEAMARAFWPGPLTLIVLRSPLAASEVTGGLPSVGLRVPDHPVAQALLEAFGGGIAAPSANRFGRVSPTTAADVQAELGNRVDLILDGGACTVGIESTIVDCTTEPMTLLRPGAISAAQLEAVLQSDVETQRVGPARAPGMLESHYAPRARVELHPAERLRQRALELVGEGLRVGVLAPAALPGLPPDVHQLEKAGSPEQYARVLYQRLRSADVRGFQVLLVEPPPAEGVGLAVCDRLRRAAAAG